MNWNDSYFHQVAAFYQRRPVALNKNNFKHNLKQILYFYCILTVNSRLNRSLTYASAVRLLIFKFETNLVLLVHFNSKLKLKSFDDLLTCASAVRLLISKGDATKYWKRLIVTRRIALNWMNERKTARFTPTSRPGGHVPNFHLIIDPSGNLDN